VYGKKRYKKDKIKTLLKAQIDNSIDVGWKVEDIILLCNFEFEFMGVKSIVNELDHECLTGSKMFGVKYLYDHDMVGDEVIWAHDLDAWQNVPFYCPEIKDVGIASYNIKKYNGGSVFWTLKAKDIAEEVIKTILEEDRTIEENSLNKIFRSKEYRDRVTNVDNTFNVGCSGFVTRWARSIKPIRVCHFHPYNPIAWETHGMDRNAIGVKCVSDRLERVLRKYYKLATKLSEGGIRAYEERKDVSKIKVKEIEKLKEKISLDIK
jgi:hypothetical protein